VARVVRRRQVRLSVSRRSLPGGLRRALDRREPDPPSPEIDLSPAPSSVLALWVEYLLTQRFELVSRLLETIREPYLADTTPLREGLVDVLAVNASRPAARA
jgi:hypothetical protein